MGGGAFLIVRPKLAALKARATARLVARQQAEAAARAADEAEHRKQAEAAAAAAAQKKLDDELSALKRRAQGDHRG